MRGELSNWTFYGGIVAAAVVVIGLVIAVADGSQTTPEEQSPFRTVPEEVLSPDG